MTTRYLGAPIARNEDRRLLTGRALFVNDVERPGMLHVAFLRSPHAHARLGTVDLSPVRARSDAMFAGWAYPEAMTRGGAFARPCAGHPWSQPRNMEAPLIHPWRKPDSNF